MKEMGEIYFEVAYYFEELDRMVATMEEEIADEHPSPAVIGSPEISEDDMNDLERYNMADPLIPGRSSHPEALKLRRLRTACRHLEAQIEKPRRDLILKHVQKYIEDEVEADRNVEYFHNQYLKRNENFEIINPWSILRRAKLAIQNVARRLELVKISAREAAMAEEDQYSEDIKRFRFSTNFLRYQDPVDAPYLLDVPARKTLEQLHRSCSRASTSSDNSATVSRPGLQSQARTSATSSPVIHFPIEPPPTVRERPLPTIFGDIIDEHERARLLAIKSPSPPRDVQPDSSEPSTSSASPEKHRKRGPFSKARRSALTPDRSPPRKRGNTTRRRRITEKDASVSPERSEATSPQSSTMSSLEQGDLDEEKRVSPIKLKLYELNGKQTGFVIGKSAPVIQDERPEEESIPGPSNWMRPPINDEDLPENNKNEREGFERRSLDSILSPGTQAKFENYMDRRLQEAASQNRIPSSPDTRNESTESSRPSTSSGRTKSPSLSSSQGTTALNSPAVPVGHAFNMVPESSRPSTCGGNADLSSHPSSHGTTALNSPAVPASSAAFNMPCASDIRSEPAYHVSDPRPTSWHLPRRSPLLPLPLPPPLPQSALSRRNSFIRATSPPVYAPAYEWGESWRPEEPPRGEPGSSGAEDGWTMESWRHEESQGEQPGGSGAPAVANEEGVDKKADEDRDVEIFNGILAKIMDSGVSNVPIPELTAMKQNLTKIVSTTDRLGQVAEDLLQQLGARLDTLTGDEKARADAKSALESMHDYSEDEDDERKRPRMSPLNEEKQEERHDNMDVVDMEISPIPSERDTEEKEEGGVNEEEKGDPKEKEEGEEVEERRTFTITIDSDEDGEESPFTLSPASPRGIEVITLSDDEEKTYKKIKEEEDEERKIDEIIASVKDEPGPEDAQQDPGAGLGDVNESERSSSLPRAYMPNFSRAYEERAVSEDASSSRRARSSQLRSPDHSSSTQSVHYQRAYHATRSPHATDTSPSSNQRGCNERSYGASDEASPRYRHGANERSGADSRDTSPRFRRAFNNHYRDTAAAAYPSRNRHGTHRDAARQYPPRYRQDSNERAEDANEKTSPRYRGGDHASPHASDTSPSRYRPAFNGRYTDASQAPTPRFKRAFNNNYRDAAGDAASSAPEHVRLKPYFVSRSTPCCGRFHYECRTGDRHRKSTSPKLHS